MTKFIDPDSEKAEIKDTVTVSSHSRIFTRLLLSAAICLSLYVTLSPTPSQVLVSQLDSQLCPQVNPISPTTNAPLSDHIDHFLGGSGAKWAIESLSGAVQIPSELFFKAC
jgi:hypothetical protein